MTTEQTPAWLAEERAAAGTAAEAPDVDLNAAAPVSAAVSKASIARRQSSTSAGTACWLTATRALAVSSKLTDLSGNCRAGM